MGNEGSALGNCCAKEEIEEVKKRDMAQTLSFDAANTTQEGSPDGKTRQERE